MRTIDADRFAAYYTTRYGVVRRTAYLLCVDWYEAEDLTQTVFVRLYLAWGRIRTDGVHAYARRVLLNEFLHRRRSRERPVDTVPDRPDPAGGSPDDRLDLSAALRAVPARQRAVVVLRYWEGLSVDQTANRSDDPGARAWATWVRTKLGPKAAKAKPGPVEWLRMCELDMGYTVFPPHSQNHAEFALPVRSGTGTDNLTVATDRFTRLPDLYRAPCKDNLITQNVSCRQRRLPDGSLLVQHDFFDILIYGDPNDPATKRDKAADREATRIFPDGRTVTAGLAYNGQPSYKRSFDRHVLSLDELAALVTDPGALKFFPRR
jgi:RNA polymerase sigma factor (sigma-70 family)